MILKTYFLLSLAICFSSITVSAQNNFNRIQLNQIGFYPHSDKIAVITGECPATVFYITSTNLRDTVLRGTLSAPKLSHFSSTICRIADFSSLQKAGSYQLSVPGYAHSYTFSISANVHRNAAAASIKGYYYQRSSIPLDEKFAGKWHRSAGHPDTRVLVHPDAASVQRPQETIISTPGGWYDAGDYNKYIVNSGISMGTLFAAWEEFPEFYKNLKTNIPESGNGIPDLLNECIYNLRWMLTMQDPNDGGVYNKCTNAAFDGMVMPGASHLPRYVVAKGTAAALDFAAVTAQAARILKNYKKDLSDSCLTAASKAWQWAEKNPDLAYDQNELNRKYKPIITTGAYGDSNFRDEWFWAASELLITTRSPGYYTTMIKYQPRQFTVPSWSNVDMLGVYSLVRNRKHLPQIAAASVQKFSAHLISYADSLLSNTRSTFKTVMGQNNKDFIWGSNSVAANQGMVLINAFQLSGDNKYIRGALSNLDYIMGRNATGYCFLTGFGSHSSIHPHHRQSVSDGVTEPVPGLLTASPNPGRQDGAQYEFTEPETAYTDNSEAYACNEIAINWNAPLVFLLGAIESLQMHL